MYVCIIVLFPPSTHRYGTADLCLHHVLLVANMVSLSSPSSSLHLLSRGYGRTEIVPGPLAEVMIGVSGSGGEGQLSLFTHTHTHTHTPPSCVTMFTVFPDVWFA